jgi:ribosome-binding factor A
MPGHRTDQVGAQVREEIMEIIRRDLKDPRIGFVSITHVRMSGDLRQARIGVSVLGDEAERKRTMEGLRSATGVIRHELGRRLENLRFSPELRFELDTSIEYSVHISKKLREILPESPPEARDDEEREGSRAEEE